MIGPILQALWQQIGPAVQQAFNLAAPYLRRIPPNVYANAANKLSIDVSRWYDSLDAESRIKIDGAITWVLKDLAGDFATAATGLPIGQLVEKALDIAWEHKSSPEARIYINDELMRQISVERHKLIVGAKESS